MKQHFTDERTGISYTLQGDYYLPDLALPAEEQVEVGIWGQRHLQYIKAHRKGFYTTLLTKCELNRHLADVNKQAEDMPLTGMLPPLRWWTAICTGSIFCRPKRRLRIS